MRVAAVIVRWRGGDEVDRCLESLLAQNFGDDLRIVLVDSGSADGGAERLAATYSRVEVVALAENLSFAHAANTGVAATDEELLLLLNPDTELEPGAVANLTAEIEDRPDTAGVVPLLVGTDGESQHRWQLRRLPTVSRLASGRPGAPEFFSVPRSPVPVAQPAAAAWMLRREVWSALDGLDAEFSPAWWEDVDFCARLRSRLGDSDFPVRRGFVVVPTVAIRHQGGSSVGSLGQDAFLHAYATNLLRYAERHHSRQFRLIRVGVRLSLLTRGVLRPRLLGAHLGVARSV